jgi:hypothetical protein
MNEQVREIVSSNQFCEFPLPIFIREKDAKLIGPTLDPTDETFIGASGVRCSLERSYITLKAAISLGYEQSKDCRFIFRLSNVDNIAAFRCPEERSEFVIE